MRSSFVLLVLFVLCNSTLAQLPGPREGATLLPNGWTITPAGKHLPAKDTVLNLKLSPDGKFIAALSSGYNEHALMILDTATQAMVQEMPLPPSWLGLAWAPDGKTIFVSGGNRGSGEKNHAIIHAIPFADGKADIDGRKTLDDPARGKNAWSGLISHPTKPLLYACNRTAGEIVAFDYAAGTVAGRVKVERDPYGLAISPDGATLYCTNWASDSLSIIDTAAMKMTQTVKAGDNPNDLVLLPDGRLFVCTADDNSVRSFDTATRRFTERIVTSLEPNAPEGSMPNALTYDPALKRLYVANGDNYNVCVIDVAEAGECSVLGFIPAGWFTTAVALGPDGKQLYVGNSKGLAGWATPEGPKRPDMGLTSKTESIKDLMTGDVSIVDLAGGDLAQWTEQCKKNSPYRDEQLSQAAPAPKPSVVPREVGAGSAIKHVIYIIKENRTYDQVFGDIKGGNGDPKLCLFGEEITPNQHALAKQFVLLDNLYCDAEVSAGGHQWSNAAYATDAVEKTWPGSYGGKITSDYTNASVPASGYLWDQANRRGLTYRTYGEFAMRQSDRSSVKPTMEGRGALVGHTAPNYLGWDATDPENAKEFIAEFDEYETHFEDESPEKRLPNYVVMCLPQDHTKGTRKGGPTPRACVANNDYAVGLIVDRVSHSKYWPETAIFIIEDDAQDGSDHVDARRTTGQCISPYTRRGMVDSTLYTTSSMLRTIELLLGLQPMSQFDASATPMYNALGDTADLSAFTHIEPKIDLDEKNTGGLFGANESEQMDFSGPDRTPMFALNEIVWKSVKGKHSRMPLPVHRYAGAVFAGDADGDEDVAEK